MTMERALASAIQSTAAGDDNASVWLVPCRGRLFQGHHQEQTTTRLLLRSNEDDDNVACLLDEISPPVSDLDEQVIERPMLLGVAMVRALGASPHEATVLAAAAITHLPGLDDEGEAYRDGGFGAVPASAAAVARLKKEAFLRREGSTEPGGGITAGCMICLEDFLDGEEVAVMPCGGERGHEFHPDCIAQWLGHSNMPALPASTAN